MQVAEDKVVGLGYADLCTRLLKISLGKGRAGQITQNGRRPDRLRHFLGQQLGRPAAPVKRASANAVGETGKFVPRVPRHAPYFLLGLVKPVLPGGFQILDTGGPRDIETEDRKVLHMLGENDGPSLQNQNAVSTCSVTKA